MLTQADVNAAKPLAAILEDALEKCGCTISKTRNITENIGMRAVLALAITLRREGHF